MNLRSKVIATGVISYAEIAFYRTRKWKERYVARIIV